MTNYSLSDNGANFIASHEGGFRLKWYDLNDGYLTVGAGHTITHSLAKAKGIRVGDSITKEQAIKWFEEDCKSFIDGTNKYLNQFKFTVNSNQFDALVSYAYNRGLGSAKYDNGLYQLLNHSPSVSAISNNFLVYWGTNQQYKNGLLNRRRAEKTLFDTPAITQVSKPVTKPMTPTASKKEYKYKNKRDSTSLIDFMDANGLDSKIGNRTLLSKKYLIKGYSGTFGQNVLLLQKLKNETVRDKVDQYFTTNPKNVITKTTVTLYKSPEFTDSNIVRTYPSGTPFTIDGVVKSKGGTPRLNTHSGFFITANKSYVKKA